MSSQIHIPKFRVNEPKADFLNKTKFVISNGFSKTFQPFILNTFKCFDFPKNIQALPFNLQSHLISMV